ncbi:MAG: hypothetical protein ABIU09_02900 [Pyrinomonadaceae bacterium]
MVAGWLLVSFIAFCGSGLQVFAHGGEDHGDSQPKTAVSDKGTVSHTSRIGELELMIKHPAMEPDTANLARLFITKYSTNEAADKVTAVIEIESQNGAVTPVAVEKVDAVGSYNLKIPALPEGTYTMRAKITYGGETDTATFSGVTVSHPAAEAATGTTWLRSTLMVLVSAVVLALFAGLGYFVWRFADEGEIRNETVSV